MSFLTNYINAYGSTFKEEMLWDVAVRKINENNSEWKVITHSSKRYWSADPFLFQNGVDTYLFYERYDRKREIGELAYRKVNVDLTMGNEKVVISRPYHLSFPNIFIHNGLIYMIPETSANRSLEVYRAVEFPDNWVLHTIIINDIQAVDTIIYEDNKNELVLLTSIVEKNACDVKNVKIYLNPDFSYKNMRSFKNTSEYGNRNAGKLIQKDGKVYRVGQDCKDGSYGKGIIVYEQVSSWENEVAYFGIEDIFPSNNKYSGVHTYNSTECFETVDLRYLQPRSLKMKVRMIIRLGGNYVKRRITH